jgi:hypothetical protein
MAPNTGDILFLGRTIMGTKWAFLVLLLLGVNLAKVKKLCVGVGDQANPKAGGAGRIYIDDVQLRKSPPAQ